MYANDVSNCRLSSWWRENPSNVLFSLKALQLVESSHTSECLATTHLQRSFTENMLTIFPVESRTSKWRMSLARTCGVLALENLENMNLGIVEIKN